MLTIRLTRKGKKNQPFFRIVVIDKRRSSKGGRAVEELGYVNPLTKKNSIEKERVLYWISKGAKPTPRIHNLLVSEKIIEAKKINLFTKTKKAKTAEVAATAALAAGDSAKEATKAAPTETPNLEAIEKPIEAPKEELKPAETPKIEEKPAS